MLQSIKLIIILVFLTWVIYFASLFLPIQQYGLIPRTIPGLIGIVTSPFLHGSMIHLIGNSISFIMFAVLLATLEGRSMFAKMLPMVIIGGVLTWSLARNGNHIGASGLIFSLWGYLVFSGWFSRKLKYILVSIGLMVFYGGMIFGILPGAIGISWESHLFGFIAGFFVAWRFHRP